MVGSGGFFFSKVYILSSLNDLKVHIWREIVAKEDFLVLPNFAQFRSFFICHFKLNKPKQ